MIFTMGDLSRRYKCPNNFGQFCCPKSCHVTDEERGYMKWNIKAVTDFAIWVPQRECIYKTSCKKPEKKKHMPVVLVSKSLCQVLRLPECIDCKTAMIHTADGPGQVAYFVLKEHAWKKKRIQNNKSKTVVNNEACHCPAKPQANLSVEKKRKQIITLNSPCSGQGPTYLVSQSYFCFQNVCS